MECEYVKEGMCLHVETETLNGSSIIAICRFQIACEHCLMTLIAQRIRTDEIILLRCN